MDLATILAVLGGIVVGGGVAAAVCASLWGGRLKAESERVARLEQARKQADEQSQHLRQRLEQLQKDMAELHHQAARARARPAEAAAPAEVQDLLLRDAPAGEAFPATMILPRKPPQQPGAGGDEPFPATMIVPRKPNA